jgi:transcriptional regulator
LGDLAPLPHKGRATPAELASSIDNLGEAPILSLHKSLRGDVGTLDLLQGTLDLLVLRTLSWGPMHGYTVARFIRERSDGAFLIEEGALYPALHRLERQGWIESEWGLSENNRKARFYQLTPRGRAQLRAQVSNWKRYTDAVAGVLEPA